MAVKKAEEILQNLMQLAELLDEEALRRLPDLPFLELARIISIRQVPLIQEEGVLPPAVKE